MTLFPANPLVHSVNLACSDIKKHCWCLTAWNTVTMFGNMYTSGKTLFYWFKDLPHKTCTVCMKIVCTGLAMFAPEVYLSPSLCVVACLEYIQTHWNTSLIFHRHKVQVPALSQVTSDHSNLGFSWAGLHIFLEGIFWSILKNINNKCITSCWCFMKLTTILHAESVPVSVTR